MLARFLFLTKTTLLVFEGPILYNYWCLNGPISRFIGVRKVILTDGKLRSISHFNTDKFDIGLFIHQLLFYHFSKSRVWLPLSRKG